MSGTERVDLRKLIDRLSPGEMVIGAASLAVLVGLLLDWQSASCSGLACGGLGSAGESGFHGWGWLTFIALIGVAGLLVARRFLAEQVTLPALPAPDAVLLMAGGGLQVLGVLLFWVEYHGNFGSLGTGVASYSVGLGLGWFVALVGGVATVAGGYLTMRNAQPVAAQPSFSPPPAAPIPPAAG
ncbi:MAG TPA: hypothetical protein VGL20_09390 [Candidatus Dormibacteraeota bacterium]|jgi:hypothetical protein